MGLLVNNFTIVTGGLCLAGLNAALNMSGQIPYEQYLMQSAGIVTVCFGAVAYRSDSQPRKKKAKSSVDATRQNPGPVKWEVQERPQEQKKKEKIGPDHPKWNLLHPSQRALYEAEQDAINKQKREEAYRRARDNALSRTAPSSEAS